MRTRQVSHTPRSRPCILAASKKHTRGRTQLLTTNAALRKKGEDWNPEAEVIADCLTWGAWNENHRSAEDRLGVSEAPASS